MWVWKQVRRKKEDSRVSRPVTGREGLGVVVVVYEEEGAWGGGCFSEEVVLALGLLLGRLLVVEEEVGFVVGIRGVRDFVMAWTPWKVPARTR